jgi:hypothetical protein
MAITEVQEVEKLAFELSEKDRARLAGKLLASLPSPFEDEGDDGVEEAIRRSREMDEDPAMSLSEEEFFASFENYRG